MTEDQDKPQSSDPGNPPSHAGSPPAAGDPSPADAAAPDSPKPPAGPPPAEAQSAGATSGDVPAKPAVPKPPAKPAAPTKPKGPQKEPLTDPIVDALNEKFDGQILDAYTFLDLRHIVIRKDRLTEVMRFLRSNTVEAFDFLSDETATHWPADDEFELVYVLFSFVTNSRVVVHTRTREWETVESLVPVWPGANWLEREIYDMFGVRFVNHPDLKRILLPEDWNGFPLRKDYNMRLQDVDWVRKHLGIESGQRFYVGEARHDDA